MNVDACYLLIAHISKAYGVAGRTLTNHHELHWSKSGKVSSKTSIPLDHHTPQETIMMDTYKNMLGEILSYFFAS